MEGGRGGGQTYRHRDPGHPGIFGIPQTRGGAQVNCLFTGHPKYFNLSVPDMYAEHGPRILGEI